MRKRVEPVRVYFATDPLCPWSFAMEPVVASLRTDDSLALRSVLVGWLPSLEARGAEAVKEEWADAAAKTGTRVDPTYWDRVAPRTSLIACAAVKGADFQGAAKGEAYLSALRRAAFEEGADLTSPEVLTTLAEPAKLKADLFRGDLGVGRYGVEDVVKAIDPAQPLSESVWWFARRRMLRAWEALAEDVRSAESKGLSSPAFVLLHGKKEAVLKGLVTEPQVREALRSVT